MKLANQFMIASVTALGLGLVTAYAQPKPGPADKKAPAAEACPCASAGQCPAGCKCGPCAMGADAGAVCAPGACPQASAECPMPDLASLAEVKVEKTKTGAALQLTAKDAAKIAEVQAMAAKMAELMKSGGCCPMMRGHGPHGRGPGAGPGPGPGPGRGRPMTPPAK